MAVLNEHWVGSFNDEYIGRIEEHKTVVKGKVSFLCGCGDKIDVLFRKKLSDDTEKYPEEDYRFTISHRSKSSVMVTDEPNEINLFDRMYKVSSGGYKTCRWPR